MKINLSKDVFTLVFGLACMITGAALMKMWKDRHVSPPDGGVRYEIIKKEVHDTLYIAEPTLSETILVPVPAYVDTAAILSDYFSTRIYDDTVRLTDFIDVRLTDSVSSNKLLSHKIELLSYPEFVCTKPPDAISARCIALGAQVGKNHWQINAQLHIKRHIITAGYDIMNNSPVVGYGYKLKQW